MKAFDLLGCYAALVTDVSETPAGPIFKDRAVQVKQPGQKTETEQMKSASIVRFVV
jgi:hypothetical protein